MSSDSDRDNNKRGKKKEKKRYYKKKGGDAHVCREWDSDESSTDSSSDEDAANITVNKGLLFPNVGHKCFMAKDGKKNKVQLKGKCAFGPFLSILVIKCQHKCLNVNQCPWMNNLEPPPSILHLVMRVVLVMMKMIYLLFLPTLTCNKKKN
jgi:hypothetical protein